jgi:hypothetical protein
MPRVMGDRVQLQQVLMNLMMNSIDAMKDVGRMRELIIQSQSGEEGQVLISFSDTGVGLPPQQADKIFNAFFTTKPHGRAWAWDCGSAAPSSNRTGADCGLLRTLRAAQNFVSHYLPAVRYTTQLGCAAECIILRAAGSSDRRRERAGPESRPRPALRPA